jgi:L-lactate utilization protein LutC
MHNELRYQVKTHAISEKLSKERNKVLHLLPNYYFFLLKNETEKKQQRHAYGKGNDI